MLDMILGFVRSLIPKNLYKRAQPIYHWLMSFAAAIRYGFPAYSKKLTIIGITGTKGKSSTAEFMNSILTTAGYKTALTGTIHFKVGEDEIPNLYKMSMPGRFFMQKFIAEAKKAGCSHIILEITSEGSKFFRNNWIPLDAFLFTNLSPEHIESHGSFKKYRDAKLRITKSLKSSSALISNTDDDHGVQFLNRARDEKIASSLTNLDTYQASDRSISFTYKGVDFSSSIPGEFTISNILLTVLTAEYLNIPLETIVQGVSNVTRLPGRLEQVKAGQDYEVIVDYAHTPDSLEALYKVYGNRHKICVLGNCGGGRDIWKRPQMAKIAEQYCDHIILTDEDPYDEDPRDIIKQMSSAIKDIKKLTIEYDRREAIRKSLSHAQDGSVVLITGKGTDPYIMRANGEKEPWSDVQVTTEEILKSLGTFSESTQNPEEKTQNLNNQNKTESPNSEVIIPRTTDQSSTL